MGRLLVLGGVLLAMAACVEEPAGPAGQTLGATERAACEAAGGTVGRGGLLPDELCFRPTPDAGKSCRKASDCTGFCLTDSLTCSAVVPQFGCFEMMTEDGRKAGLCVD